MLGRGNKPVSPSTLRRYIPQFRLYDVWARHRSLTERPSADEVAHACASLGLAAQYNRPITAEHVRGHTRDFERRWQALRGHHAAAEG